MANSSVTANASRGSPESSTICDFEPNGSHCSLVFRPLAAIIAAIQLSQPKVSDVDANLIAHALQAEAQQHDFDPLTGVSIIHHESGFDPHAISRSGEDYGLAQIRARYIGGCKGTKDPVHHPTAACRREQERLLKARYNIHVMAELITRNRKFCKAKVGSALFHRWLASYQGRNYPKQKRWCQPGDATWEVINYRKHLIRELNKQKRSRK